MKGPERESGISEGAIPVENREARECGLSWRVSPIGVVHTPYTARTEVPKHFERVGRGTVELFPDFQNGLQDIEGFSHLWLVTFLHLSEGFNLTLVPRGRRAVHGLFTTRSPRRPNPIGLSLVKLVERQGAFLHVLGLDLWDGTPILDIKPFLLRCDEVSEAKCGWCDCEESL